MGMEIVEKVHALMEELVCSGTEVTAKQLGLDPRAWANLYLVEDVGIVVEGRTNSLEYYGGFEYVDEDDKVIVGNYTIYSCQASRVQECIEHFDETGEENAHG